MLLIAGLILFVCLVLVHEFGHFIAARRNGVEVEEFGVGFPPKVWSIKRKSGLVISVNALPLGGFVRLKGEHDADTHNGSFGAASLWAKVKIMLAGVAMNLLTAFMLLTLLALLGMPKLVENQFTVASDTKVARQEVRIASVESGSPAAIAGLQDGDKILAVGGYSVQAVEELMQATKMSQGSKVEVVYERGGERRTHAVQLRAEAEVEASKNTANPKGYLGVEPGEYILQRSTWSAPIVAAGLIKQFTVLTFQGLGNIFANLFQGNAQKAGEQVSGPVGIFAILKNGSNLGYQFILMIIAIISLTLAIMNILPIPALDGGRLFVTLLYRIIKRPLTEKTEDRIHGTAFMILIALFMLVTVVDIKRLFNAG